MNENHNKKSKRERGGGETTIKEGKNDEPRLSPNRIDLQNSRASNDIRIAEVGIGGAQHDVDLARHAGGDGDFVVLVALGDSDLDGDLLEAGEEDGVDGGAGGDGGREGHGVEEGVVERHGGAAGSRDAD